MDTDDELASQRTAGPTVHRTSARYWIKTGANGLALMMVAPLALAYAVTSLVSGGERCFPGYSQLFSLAPGLLGQFLRRAFYRLVLPACGDDACVSFGTIISHPTARLHDRCYVGNFCVLGDVTLEPDVLVGSHASIINGNRQHGIERLDLPVREQPGKYPRITIGTDSWIGDRAIVMADVGRHAVVGAGSVVTRPVPDFAIVVGNPARVVAYRAEHGVRSATDDLQAEARSN